MTTKPIDTRCLPTKNSGFATNGRTTLPATAIEATAATLDLLPNPTLTAGRHLSPAANSPDPRGSSPQGSGQHIPGQPDDADLSQSTSQNETVSHIETAGGRPSQSIRLAVICLVITSVFWGMSFPLTKTVHLQVEQHFGLAPDVSSWALRLAATGWLMFCRFTVALLVFTLLFHRLVVHATAAEWRGGALIGICFSGGLILQIVGIVSIPASRSGFLTSLVAVFTPLITAGVLRLWPRPQVTIGVAVALLGVAVLTGLLSPAGSAGHGGGGHGVAVSAASLWTIGDTLTTLGAVLFASQICLVDYYGRRVQAAALTPGMLATTALIGLTVFLATVFQVPELPVTEQAAELAESAGGIVGNQQAASPTASASLLGTWWTLSSKTGFWLPVLLLSLFSTVLAFHLMNSYQHYITATQAGVIYTLEPVFASTGAMFLPLWLSLATGLSYANERLVAAMVIGGGLIVIANLISLCPVPRRFRRSGQAVSPAS